MTRTNKIKQNKQIRQNNLLQKKILVFQKIDYVYLKSDTIML